MISTITIFIVNSIDCSCIALCKHGEQEDSKRRNKYSKYVEQHQDKAVKQTVSSSKYEIPRLACHTSIDSGSKQTVIPYGFRQCITYTNHISKISMLSVPHLLVP